MARTQQERAEIPGIALLVGLAVAAVVVYRLLSGRTPDDDVANEFYERIAVHSDEIPTISDEDGWGLLESEARDYFDMSVSEFQTAWEQHAFPPEDRERAAEVAMLLPFARSRMAVV